MFHEVYVKALSEELAAQGAGVKDNAGTYYEALGFTYDQSTDTYILDVAA